MKLVLSAAALALATFVGSGLARADWLGDAWSEESVRRNGNPAITIHRDSIHVVLPAATLRQAYDEGATTERVLSEFLERYGQRCSSLLKLNAPHPNLKVRLSLQTRTSFDEISEDDEVLTALKTEYLKRTETGSPVLFTTSPGHFDYTINYVPKRQVRCVTPEMPTS
ncbi:MAG TPA: hypothetical protein VHM01_07265 [Alphaproteobacteria bacterium]|nr:hypothetical protein [Alphaproteobacteria bacterium]